MPQSVYRLEVADSRGRLIVARPVTLSEFGTFHESLPLDPATPVGTYRVRVYQPGKSDFAGAFEVDSYQLQPIDLAFDLKKTVFYRGDKVEGDLLARYQYGAPVANRPDRRQSARRPDPPRHDRRRRQVSLRVPHRGVLRRARASRWRPGCRKTMWRRGATVMLAIRAFGIGLSTSRDVYLDGESFPLQVVTTDPLGEPTGESLSAALVKLVTTQGRVTEREIQRKPLTTDAEDGSRLAHLPGRRYPGGPIHPPRRRHRPVRQSDRRRSRADDLG